MHEGLGMGATTRDEAGSLVWAWLAGGHTDSAGVLRGARVALMWPYDGGIWEGFDRSLNPCMVAGGRFAGGNVLLVGARKTTLFDPVERERPFIYTIRADQKGLRKRWLGTSLSRPFIAATFANLDGAGEDELCALERTHTGGWSVSAYVWEGFGVEGLGCSPELPPSDAPPELTDLGTPDGHRLILMTRHAGQATFTALGLRAGPDPASPLLIPVARLVVTVGPAPFTWAPYSSPTIPLGVTLFRGRLLRALPLKPVP
jgi:hypothetical protein